MSTFAYECYVYGDVFLILRDVCGLGIRRLHSFSQGEVINHVFDDRARFGMVDEDPNKTHHAKRDGMPTINGLADIEYRRSGDRHVFLLKPALEECFRRAMGLVQLESELPASPRDLRRALGVANSGHAAHRKFREELRELRAEAQRKHISIFLTTLEDMLRSVL